MSYISLFILNCDCLSCSTFQNIPIDIFDKSAGFVSDCCTVLTQPLCHTWKLGFDLNSPTFRVLFADINLKNIWLYEMVTFVCSTFALIHFLWSVKSCIFTFTKSLHYRNKQLETTFLSERAASLNDGYHMIASFPGGRQTKALKWRGGDYILAFLRYGASLIQYSQTH